MKMEGNTNPSKSQELTDEEKFDLTDAKMQAIAIEEYILNRRPIDEEWLINVDDTINDLYENCSTWPNRKGLSSMYSEFQEFIRVTEEDFEYHISEYLLEKVEEDGIFGEEQIIKLRHWINRLKLVNIPRLKKLELNDLVKSLEGTILQLEIRIANDVEE